MEKSEKKRSANFSHREKQTIISLVEKYFSIIENKKTNCVFNKEKAECWGKLAHEFNALQISGQRTASQLRSAYEKMKQIAKKHKSEDKVEILKTGGGTFTPTLTDLDEKILNLLKKNIFYIKNSCDSNAKMTIPQPTTSKDDSECLEEILLICEPEEFSVCASTSFQTEKSTPFMETSNCPGQLDNESNEEEINEIETLDKEIFYNTTNKHKTPLRKRKFQSASEQIIRAKYNKDNLCDKKMELVQIKIDTMKVMKMAEEENLNGKCIDNEIKEIIKKKEELELKIKEREYKNLLY